MVLVKLLIEPTGVGSAYTYGKKVSDFAAACLDGGGCVQICKAYVVSLPIPDNYKFPLEKDKLEYIKMVDETHSILIKKPELL